MKNAIGTSDQGDVFLPDDAVTQGFALLARRRSGKSNLAGVIEETLCERGDPWVVLDPVSAHWGIRYRDDDGQPGKPSGYDVLIVGGKYGDVALDERQGGALAQILVDTGISCVIDLGGESMNAQQRFVAEFAAELLRINETPRHVLLEEAHTFVPQVPSFENQKLVLGALTKMITMGGGKGIGFTLITQRSASIAKSVLEQIDNLFVLRMSGPRDLKSVQDWFEHNIGEAREMKRILESLRGFQPGEAWWLSDTALERLTVRLRRTYHAGRTPKRGEALVQPKRVELREVIGRYRKAAEKRAVTVREERDLKAELARLTRELAAAKKAQPAPLAAVKPCDHEREIARLRKDLDTAEGFRMHVHENAQLARSAIAEAASAINALSGLSKIAASARRAPVPVSAPQVREPNRNRGTAPPIRPAPARPVISSNGAEPTLDGITGGAMRMLERLAERHPETWTRAQLATLARIKKTGGTFGTYFSRLTQRGLIAERDGRVAITDAGLDVMGGPPDQPQTREELIEAWRGRLTGGARRMLDVLLDAGERGVPRDELAERAGITMTGGTFGTYLSRLMSNGLVEKDGDRLVASDMLIEG